MLQHTHRPARAQAGLAFAIALALHVAPAPYSEPAEDAFIVHYTKVVVNAFGLSEG